MKGLILSGGKGTRLRPLTYTNAKQLIPIANKPILFFGIEAIVRTGIEDIGIVVGETRDEVMSTVGDGSKFGCNITYIHQEEPLGLAHAVKVSEDFLSDDRFVMYLGYNVIKDGIDDLVKEFREKKPNSQILLAKVPDPSQFGVAELDGERVVRLEEKPREPRSDLALVGVYMFDRHIFEAVNSIKPSWRGELEITDAISWLIEKGLEVVPHVIQGWWKDTGKLEDLLEANRIMLDLLERDIRGSIYKNSKVEGKVVLEEGAKIIGSHVRGPAIIGSGAEIVSSYIGPFTSIGPGARVENSEVEHSILLNEAQILNVGSRLQDSLIGHRARVTKTEGLPRVLRFMLGDMSEANLL